MMRKVTGKCYDEVLSGVNNNDISNQHEPSTL